MTQDPSNLPILTIDELANIIAMHQRAGRGQWRVIMQHDVDGDLIIGTFLRWTRPDRFHQALGLWGRVSDEDVEKWRTRIP